MKLFLIMTLVLGMIYLLGMLKVESDVNWMGKECTTGLKGLAVLMVVWGHIGACLHVSGIQFIGGVGVSIFLILSGYGLEKSYTNNGLKKFWTKKLIKIFIPFWIIELIGSIATCDFDIKNYILDVLFLKPGTAYGWYMGYLFICYCLFYIYKTLIEKKIVKDDRGGGTAICSVVCY